LSQNPRKQLALLNIEIDPHKVYQQEKDESAVAFPRFPMPSRLFLWTCENFLPLQLWPSIYGRY